LFVAAFNTKSKEKVMKKFRYLKRLSGVSLLLIGIILLAPITSVALGEDIQKSMDIGNPALEFSLGTKIHNDGAYMAIIMIAFDYSVPYHRDMQLIKLMGIKKLDIYLNCPGGSLVAGFALFDDLMVLKQSGVHIKVHARGIVGSMAIPILLVGDERIGSKHTQFFLHPHSIFKQGLFAEEQRDLEIQSRRMEMYKQFYTDVLVETTKLSKEKISEMMDKTTYFTVQQALEWGFIDKIIGE
jgi:ATP-dependent protease ClpP protease subunit